MSYMSLFDKDWGIKDKSNDVELDLNYLFQ